MAYCRVCGNELPENAPICPICGTNAPVSASESSAEKEPHAEKSSKGKRLLYFLLAILILIAYWGFDGLLTFIRHLLGA